MSEEELNRKMEFIIEQQAQFVVDIQKLYETLDAERAARHEQFNKLSESIVGVVSIVGHLAESQRSMKEDLKSLKDDVKALQEQSRETGERLNIFINVVERYISEGRNGRKPE